MEASASRRLRGQLLAPLAGIQPAEVRSPLRRMRHAPTRVLCTRRTPRESRAKWRSMLTYDALFPRYVRARILLEDANTGCVASFGDKLCIILCRFSRAEHQLVLPLWHPDQQPSNTLKELIDWHTSAFASNKGARLSGDALEWKEDKEMWLKLIANGEAGI